MDLLDETSLFEYDHCWRLWRRSPHCGGGKNSRNALILTSLVPPSENLEVTDAICASQTQRGAASTAAAAAAVATATATATAARSCPHTGTHYRGTRLERSGLQWPFSCSSFKQRQHKAAAANALRCSEFFAQLTGPLTV